MDKIQLNVNKDLKYVLACSFGPDSMALLDMAIKEKLNFVVAHVNYRKRVSSQYEQDRLTEFCNERKIPIYILDLKGVKSKGNFQSWARKKRYDFFKSVSRKISADAVLVAHQEDDLLETYLMKKTRGNFAKNPGISRENELFGVKVIRPLLAYSKKELQQYDIDNNVPFAIDESNLTDHYTRNKIRHSIVEKLNKREREQLIHEIESIEQSNVKKASIYLKEEFLNFTYNQIILLLDYFMEKSKEHRDISKKFVEEIKKAFANNINQRFKITNRLWLELDYNFVYVLNGTRVKAYEFAVDKKVKKEFIELDFSNGAEDRGITNLPKKIIVKNCNKNDKVIIKNYSAKIRRLYIDWKMPLFLRDVWPGIYDEDGALIYVPRYRESFVDNHKSIFKINTKYFTEF